MAEQRQVGQSRVICSGCLQGTDHIAGINMVEGAPFVAYFLFCADCVRPVCPECEQERPDDERVREGMKCGQCAYPGQSNDIPGTGVGGEEIPF